MLHDPHGVKQKENPKADQEDRDHRNFTGVKLLAHAEAPPKAHRIGRRQARLNCLSGTDGVNDLVDVEEGNADAEDPVPIARMVAAVNQHDKYQQVRESFRVLRTIDSADAKGKEAGQYPGDHGVWAGTLPARNPRSRALTRDRRIYSLRRRKARRWQWRAFHPRCQASLAVNHSANVAGAIAAERLAACAAESYCGNIVVSGAVHTNLLYVVTDTTGRSLTDGPSGALARTTRLSNWL